MQLLSITLEELRQKAKEATERQRKQAGTSTIGGTVFGSIGEVASGVVNFALTRWRLSAYLVPVLT